MNLRTFVSFSAVAMLALGGCILVDSNAGKGGNGGSAGSNTGGEAGKGGTGGAGVGGAGGGTAGAGGMAATCGATCSEAASNGLPICDTATTTSQDLYKTLADCTCGRSSMDMTNPGCSDLCATDGCAGKVPADGSECQKCLLSTCGMDVANCAADN